MPTRKGWTCGPNPGPTVGSSWSEEFSLTLHAPHRADRDQHHGERRRHCGLLDPEVDQEWHVSLRGQRVRCDVAAKQGYCDRETEEDRPKSRLILPPNPDGSRQHTNQVQRDGDGRGNEHRASLLIAGRLNSGAPSKDG